MNRIGLLTLGRGLDLAGRRWPVISIGYVFLVAMASTFIAAVMSETPFSVWFKDTPYLLVTVLILFVVLGILWDGSLISLGLVCELLTRHAHVRATASMTVEAMRRLRFFTCGMQPLVMVLLTMFAILGTSNITLISLKLLGQVTSWRDPWLWQVEGPAIEWIATLPINVSAWDKLYHSAWGIELLASFVLILVGRDARLVKLFGISLILLFYFGRFLGLLNPVMGPALYQPGLYQYLDGSLSEKAMRLVSEVMAQAPEKAMEKGGILLGGVSAMPSLHVAMVFVTAYWLAFANRWTALATVPWVVAVWISTVVLGWHYVLDGAGGIVLGIGCLWMTNRLFGETRVLAE